MDTQSPTSATPPSLAFESLSVIPELNPRTGLPLKPDWLKVPKVSGDTLYQIKRGLRNDQLFTVCEEARCPNISECWNAGTATFMILGEVCTRGCRFCAVKTGNPGGWLDPHEPEKVANQIAQMSLQYAVITMVDRDDLPDFGSQHIQAVLAAVQQKNPQLKVELLAGDFRGNADHVQKVLWAKRPLDVFAHNIETVQRLTPRVRDARATYGRSLEVLAAVKALQPKIFTKSALMLGLGEESAEIHQSLVDLRQHHVDILTIGQYLQPSKKHLSIKRFVHPSEFDHWKEVALQLGFKAVASGPLVRSSYKASHLFPDTFG